MKLFHYSESEHSELTPQNGSRRHAGETSPAIDEPAVWLTEDPINAPQIGGWIPKFRHTVDVDADDNQLLQDLKFSGPEIPKIYFYKGTLKVSEVTEYRAVGRIVIKDGKAIHDSRATSSKPSSEA
jgi:hypothetical protein